MYSLYGRSFVNSKSNLETENRSEYHFAVGYYGVFLNEKKCRTIQ